MRIVVEATSRPLEALREGSVDLVVMTTPSCGWPVRAGDPEAGDPGSDVVVRPLFTDQYLLVTAPDHRFAGRDHVLADDLAGERLLLYSPPAESTFYQRFLSAAGVAPRETLVFHLPRRSSR